MKIRKSMLRHVIYEEVKKQMREVDVQTWTGAMVPFGSQEHIDDLEMTILGLQRRRDYQRRGSAARENYGQALKSARSELRAAKRRHGKAAMVTDPVDADPLTEKGDA
jgi:hypothetical protein